MKLIELIEHISGNAGDKAEVRKHNKKALDIAKKTFISSAPRQVPALPQQFAQTQDKPIEQPKPKATPKSKNFKFTFKDDKGSYQVRIKKNKEGKVKYNYGYYDRDEMPEISINSDALTEEGQDKYTEFKKIAKAMEKGNERKKDI